MEMTMSRIFAIAAAALLSSGAAYASDVAVTRSVPAASYLSGADLAELHAADALETIGYSQTLPADQVYDARDRAALGLGAKDSVTVTTFEGLSQPDNFNSPR